MRQARREPALVPQAGGQGTRLQHALEGVVGLGAPAQRLGERARTDRRDHEFLDVDVAVGVGSTIEDVHHRHGQHMGVGTAEVAEQRQLAELGRSPCDCQRHAQDGVGAEPGLVRCAVQFEQPLVEEALLGDLHADDFRSDTVDDVADRVLHALAAVAGAAVTQFHCFELARRSTAGHSRPGERPVLEADLDFHGGIAARVEDLASADLVDGGHETTSCRLLDVGARRSLQSLGKQDH